MKYYSIHFNSVEQLRFTMSRVINILNRRGIDKIYFNRKGEYRYDLEIGYELTFICFVRVNVGCHIDDLKILGSYNVMHDTDDYEPERIFDWIMQKYICIERGYIRNDIIATADFFIYPQIKKVIFNDPATIVFWSDGSKTVVKAQNGEIYDQEKGLAMAITKKWFGNKGNYYNNIKKYI